MRFVAFALFAAVCVIASDVLVLDDDNFDEEIAKHEKILVEFYAPWCGHCKKLEPEYDAAAKELKGKFTLAKVDATENKELASRFNIQGFPTIKLFINGEPTEYKGGRTKDTIVSYLLKQNRPVLTQLQALDIAEFSKSDKVVVVGLFKSQDSPSYRIFSRVAQQLSAEMTFGAFVSEENVAQKVTVYKKFDEQPAEFIAELTTPTLTAFLRAESIPLVDEVGPENYKTYVDSGLPLLFGFVDPSDVSQKTGLIDQLLPLAKKFRGELNFVWCDGVKYANQAKNLGLSGDFLPSVAIVNVANQDHYAFSGTLLQGEELADWVKQFVDGTLSPTLKSEPEPVQTGPVTVVVGTTYTKIVMDETKDVLVEFYAPWCGHCKSLAPIYDQLGERLKGVSSIVIAKVDATANDVPGLKIQGYPTIKFFPAKNKQPVDFDGERTVEGFIKYLKEKASIPFQVSDSDAPAAHQHPHPDEL